MVRLLQYAETPPYLKRSLFPNHSDLQFVGLLPPADAPHHVRKGEQSRWREGVTLKNDKEGEVVSFGAVAVGVVWCGRGGLTGLL